MGFIPEIKYNQGSNGKQMQTLVLEIRGRVEVRIPKPGARLMGNNNETRTKGVVPMSSYLKS